MPLLCVSVTTKSVFVLSSRENISKNKIGKEDLVVATEAVYLRSFSE